MVGCFDRPGLYRVLYRVEQASVVVNQACDGVKKFPFFAR